jgi:hypothetical protein
MTPELVERLTTRPCRACGKKLAFVRDAEGRLHPLDVVAPTFRVQADGAGLPIAVRASSTFVSHFATCPRASEFSRRSA